MPKKFIRDARRSRQQGIGSASVDGANPEPHDPNLVTGVVEVGAGTQFEVPVQAYEGCILTWSFETKGGDISFGVTFQADDANWTVQEVEDDSRRNTPSPVVLTPGEEIVLSENRRYNSDNVQVQGTVQIARHGTITLRWDNSYSYFKGKSLTYSVELEEPLGLQNGPRALGGPDIPRVIFVLGGPGSGKGTQCTRLATQFGFLHLSAGDLLRAERDDPDSEHGQLITSCIKDGKIVPVAITVALLWRAIRSSGRHFILVDGFPRNRDNLEGWQRKVGGRAQVVCCFDFEVADDVLVQRLVERAKSSGRDDDNPETVKKRLVTFHEDTLPILEYFRKRGELITINGDRPRDEVFGDVCDQLKNKLGTSLPTVDDFVLAAPRNRIPPRVILGTATIGGEGMDDSEAKQYIREFCLSEPGCDEVDTARMYSHGETEKIIGRVVAVGKPRLSSKVNPFKGQGGSLSPSSIAVQLGESLAALKADSLDILYLHAPDPAVSIEQTLEACDALHRKGKFKELGLANFAAWQVVNAFHICSSRGWVRPTVYQGTYNALVRDVESELFPALRVLGIRFYAASPLAGGLLTASFAHEHANPQKKKLEHAHQTSFSLHGRLLRPTYIEAIGEMERACNSFRITIEEASLRWIAHHSFLRTGRNDGVIVTASTAEQLKHDLHAINHSGPLPLPLVVAIDNAWEYCRVDCPPYFFY